MRRFLAVMAAVGALSAVLASPAAAAPPEVFCFDAGDRVVVFRSQVTGGGDFKSRFQERPGNCPGNAIVFGEF